MMLISAKLILLWLPVGQGDRATFCTQISKIGSYDLTQAHEVLWKMSKIYFSKEHKFFAVQRIKYVSGIVRRENACVLNVVYPYVVTAACVYVISKLFPMD